MNGSAASHEALYRWKEMLLPVLIGALVFGAAAIALTFMYVSDTNTALVITLWMMGTAFAIIVVAAVAAFRVHRWTIEADGVRMEERPKVPLAGFRRHAVVPFGEMAALSRVESGFDLMIEITTRRGVSYRMPVRATPNPKGLPTLHPEELEAFVSAISEAAVRAGCPLQPTSEALSLWNKPFGLFMQGIMLLIALGFAGLAGFTLLTGGVDRPTARMGEMYAIALLLPVGAGYLLTRSLRRRRDVLRGMLAPKDR